LLLFPVFVVPGYVALKVFDLRVPGTSRDFATGLIEVVCISMLNLSVVAWPLSLIAVTRSSLSFVYSLAWFVLFVVVPAGLATIAVWLLSQPWMRHIVLHPCRSAWDFFFVRGQTCWVICHLKSGDRVAGYFGRNSMASSFPRPEQLYLEDVWELDEESGFLRPTNESLGAIIQREDCTLIELFSSSREATP
jgi:hypothetical protein